MKWPGISWLKPEQAYVHYTKLQANPKAFDDFTPFSFEEFVGVVFSPCSASFDLGDGLGLCTFLFEGSNAFIQMVVYDYNYRLDWVTNLLRLAFRLGASRVTSAVTEDREPAKKLVLAMGATLEGRMRKAFKRGDQFYDVEVYGLLKEEFERWLQSQQQLSRR